jgi:hypothetical protein
MQSKQIVVVEGDDTHLFLSCRSPEKPRALRQPFRLTLMPPGIANRPYRFRFDILFLEGNFSG